MNAQQQEQIKHINKLKGNVLEIGVCKGGTTELFCEAVANYNGKVIAIDPLYDNDYYTAFKEVILDKYDIEFHRIESEKGIHEVKTPFSYAFIDGSHTYKDCHLDLVNVHHSIKKGGVVCLDDTNLEEVKQAMDEVIKKKMYKIIQHNNFVDHKEYVMLKVLK